MILPTNLGSVYLRDDQQGSNVVTQTITQPAVTQPAQTMTTLVTLGPSTTHAANGTGGDHGGTGGLTNVQFGAIIGCIAALVVIGIAAGICLSSNKKKSQNVYEYYTTTSSTSSGSSKRRRRKRHHPKHPPPPTEWVPGGPKFPTYKAIPISNPRNPPVAHTK